MTLKCIKNYYDSNKDEKWIKLILGEKGKNKEKQINRYKNWLNSFGDWKKFVETNFLKAFVHIENESKEPKELWEHHFEQWNEGKGTVLPKQEQCNEYFKNATEYIKERTDEMIEILEDKINEKK